MSVKRLIIYLLLLPLLAASCSKKIHPADSRTAIFYPPAPDTARIQFLARFSTSEDFTGPPSRFRSFVAGRPEIRQIKKPYGLAMTKGKLFIADPGSGGLHVMDFNENTFKLFLPEGRGRLKLPVNCSLDKDGNLYVADVERKQVVIFDRELEYIGEIGDTGVFRPTDVLIVGDTVFLSDPPNNRVCAFDRLSRKLLYSFPGSSRAGDESWLYNPVNLASAGDSIYLTDFGHSRIKIFYPEGSYVSSVGSYGRNHGQFVRPKGIAVDRDRNLYVVDAGFQNVQVFDTSGRLLMFFGGPYQGIGDMYLPAKVLVDYDNLNYFRKYVEPGYELLYLILVSNQYGPDKLTAYGRIRPE